MRGYRQSRSACNVFMFGVSHVLTELIRASSASADPDAIIASFVSQGNGTAAVTGVAAGASASARDAALSDLAHPGEETVEDEQTWLTHMQQGFQIHLCLKCSHHR
jgi:hypothetical protein